ncbi:hypothetical protein AB3S75_013039 [Citrus x aurantiifolia]
MALDVCHIVRFPSRQSKICQNAFSIAKKLAKDGKRFGRKAGIINRQRSELKPVENSSCEESTIDLEAKLACHLSFCNLQPADMEDESDLLSWQNSYGEEYQHISMEQLNF